MKNTMRKTNNLILGLALSGLLFWQCGGAEKTKEKAEEIVEEVVEESVEPSLTYLWETSEELITCESVLVDEATGKIYVTNIDGNPTDKDGNGYISIINDKGDIVEKKWLTGLDAPKGMAIDEGKLYVTDIDKLVEIDIESSSISETYPVSDAVFLNDVTINDGVVYFSDTRTGKIHKLENGEVSLFAEGQESINGLRFADGVLYGLDGSGLKEYKKDGSFTLLNEKVVGGDGLIVLGEGEFLASKWKGEIWVVKGEKAWKVLDSKADNSNTADIGFLKDENIVLVPTFQRNKVVAYELNY
ncbi:ATP-binding protein [Echinicola jeungdonensis]|uniref:ATP-binding protein n=1 Tax=Echinicola jeungdonensis TaxID=709343 RepID=A0ABV5J3W2_9BACT|nr:ATP-binding protein [Echinicola jeungdonensis]MDN3668788.1 ATP-binding protein [Echinicola jeungdonensis]